MLSPPLYPAFAEPLPDPGSGLQLGMGLFLQSENWQSQHLNTSKGGGTLSTEQACIHNPL